MQSLLRAVLTSPSDLPVPPTKVNDIQQNRSTRTTSPYLHAALTTALLRDPHISENHDHHHCRGAEQSAPTAAAGRVLGGRELRRKAGKETGTAAVGHTVSKKPSLISNRHSKLLEALTSDSRFSDNRMQTALTMALPPSLPTPPPPPVPQSQPLTTTNSIGNLADPHNLQSNTAPYKSRLFLALTSPLEHWDKDPACSSKEPNSCSDSNNNFRLGNGTVDAVGKTIKQENTTVPLDALPAGIEPVDDDDNTAATAATTPQATGQLLHRCYQHRSSSDAIRSELPESTDGCPSPSFEQSPSFEPSNHVNDTTSCRSEWSGTFFHESPEFANSQGALADIAHSAPPSSFVESRHRNDQQEMQRSSVVGNCKSFGGFSPEIATGFNQKIKTEGIAFQVTQFGPELHREAPTCAIEALSDVALVRKQHGRESTLRCVDVDVPVVRQRGEEEFGFCNEGRNHVKIESTEEHCGKPTLCVGLPVPVERRLGGEVIGAHGENNLVKIATKTKCTHFFRQKLLTQSNSPSRPSGISVAKKRKFLDRCKSRLENSDPTFSMGSSVSLLEHLAYKKQKVESVAQQRNLEKDEGSSSDYDNQIIKDCSSRVSLEHSASSSVNNGGNGGPSCMMLQNTPTENLSEYQKEFLFQSNRASGSYSNATRPSCDPTLGSANNSSSSRSLCKKNLNYAYNSPTTKSQILREALTSAPISLRKPNTGSVSVPVFDDRTIDAAYNSHANNHSGSQVRLTTNPNQNRNQNKPIVASNTSDVATMTASDKTTSKPAVGMKHSSQLLLAALTAADDLRKAPVSKPVTKQTNSEILRAALDSTESRGCPNYRSKHSQLLRAALIAVDTNKAIKEKTRETGPKFSNSRLLRAVLTGKYSPEAERRCHSKTSLSPPLPSTRRLSIASSPLDPFVVVNKNTSENKVSSNAEKTSVNTCNSRTNGHSILRAVLTGALDVPHHSVTTSCKDNEPPTHRQSRKRRGGELDFKPSPGGYFRDDDYGRGQMTELTSPAIDSRLHASAGVAVKTECRQNGSTSVVTHYGTDQLRNAEGSVGQRQKTESEKCIYCGRVHSSDDTLWPYTSLFAGEKQQHHFCHVCRQTFNITCLFLQHVEQHCDARTKYRCEFCGRYFVHVLSYIMCRLSHMDAAQREKGDVVVGNKGTELPLEFGCRVKCENGTGLQENNEDDSSNINIINDDNNTNDFHILPNNNNNNNNDDEDADDDDDDDDDDNNNHNKYEKKNNEIDAYKNGPCMGKAGGCKLFNEGLCQRRIKCFLHKTENASAYDDNDDDDGLDVACEGCTENCRCYYELQHPNGRMHVTARTPTNAATEDDNNNNNNCSCSNNSSYRNDTSNERNCKRSFQCTSCTEWFLTRKELCIHKGLLHLDIPTGVHHRRRERRNALVNRGDSDAHKCNVSLLTKTHLGCKSCGALQQRSKGKYGTSCSWNNCSGGTTKQLHPDSRCPQLVKD